jgi:hypothetical protein
MCTHACIFLTDKQYANQNDDKTNKEAGEEEPGADDKHKHSQDHNAYHVSNHSWQHEMWFLL